MIAGRARKSIAACLAAAGVMLAPGPDFYRAWGASLARSAPGAKPSAISRPFVRLQSIQGRRLAGIAPRPVGLRPAAAISGSPAFNIGVLPALESASEPKDAVSSEAAYPVQEGAETPRSASGQLKDLQTAAIAEPEAMGRRYDLGSPAPLAHTTPVSGGSSFSTPAQTSGRPARLAPAGQTGFVPAKPAPPASPAAEAEPMTRRQALKIGLITAWVALTGLMAASALGILPIPVDSFFGWTQLLPTVEPAATKPDLWRAWIPLTGIGLFTILESFVPYRKPIEPRAPHFIRNLGLTMFNGMFLYLTMSNILAVFGAVLQANHIGILNFAAGLGFMPLWLNVALSVVFFDFVTYWIHRMMHENFPLWRFHQIHHSDMDVNSTTGARIHIGEALASVVLKMLASVIWGPAAIAVAIHETVLFLGALLHHANIRMPDRLERALRWIVVTPHMHRIHHSNRSEQHDSNYSDTFSVWDRLFGTYQVPGPDNDKIVYGIATQKKLEKLKFLDLLLMPGYRWMRSLQKWLSGRLLPEAGR